MTEETENLVLGYLKPIRATTERIEADVGDLKLRMSACEVNLAQLQIQMAGMNSRMDRFDERLGRVERRLGLIDA